MRTISHTLNRSNDQSSINHAISEPQTAGQKNHRAECTTQRSAQRQAYLPHGIEREEVALVDLVLLLHVLQPRLQDLAERVLEGDPEDDDSAAVVAIKVDTLRDLSTCNLP